MHKLGNSHLGHFVADNIVCNAQVQLDHNEAVTELFENDSSFAVYSTNVENLTFPSRALVHSPTQSAYADGHGLLCNS
ncbi:hypothetical protein CEXT_664861 [Caerostris extrusa]|uniref:Uncharacterized protein n=1 Tax=Caerostris extrusa TaxID=172846 RepID=A0AAV4M970_CAEEX|nr:hypothetical protein CEXT_664861 [Caerostris extrusa]